MIDPKRVELTGYNKIPHLLAPVITEPDKNKAALKWIVKEMERRYSLFEEVGAKKIDVYNKQRVVNGEETLPKILVIIDELASMMLTSPEETEELLCRISAEGRAAGIHLVVATQSPKAEVITTLIRNNIPSRVSFSVADKTASRVVLDVNGAENLMGKGDMYYRPMGKLNAERLRGTYISDEDIECNISEVKEKFGNPKFDVELMDLLNPPTKEYFDVTYEDRYKYHEALGEREAYDKAFLEKRGLTRGLNDLEFKCLVDWSYRTKDPKKYGKIDKKRDENMEFQWVGESDEYLVDPFRPVAPLPKSGLSADWLIKNDHRHRIYKPMFSGKCTVRWEQTVPSNWKEKYEGCF
jgi:hypothetical protein